MTEFLRSRVPHSLRGRVLVSFVLVALVALVIALGTFAVALDRILTTSAQGDAEAQTAAVVRELAGSSAQEALESTPSGADVVQVIVSGKVTATTKPSVTRPLATSVPESGSASRQAMLEIGGDRDLYVVSARHATSGDRSRIVVAAVSLKNQNDIVDRTTVLLGGVAVALLLATTWGINRVISRSLNPVEQIRREVARIETSRSAGRVTVPPTDDEIARLAATMNHMLDRLDAADRTQRAFVSDASHELRSPLTTIRLLSEGYDGDGPADAGGSAASMRMIHSEALRMQDLVESLLLLAKSDDGRLALSLRDVDLDALTFAEVKRLQGISSVRVEQHLAAARVVGDEARLTQVIRNIVDNAARHARSTVRVATALTGDAAVVIVDNDGPLVPEADRERIFDRFVRLAESRDRDSGGSGLGLAIAQALARAHGGHVTTGASPEGWCRFEIRLPHPASGDDADERSDGTLAASESR